MKVLIRIAFVIAIAANGAVFEVLNSMPISLHDHVYSIAAVTSILMLFGLAFLFAILEATNYFNLFQSK